MIYVNCFLGLYEYVEVSWSASNPVSWRLASYSRKSITLACGDTPKNSACLRIPDSVEPATDKLGVAENQESLSLAGKLSVKFRPTCTQNDLALVFLCKRKEPANPGRSVHDDREQVALLCCLSWKWRSIHPSR
jgi:hypothetical protein